MLKSADHTSYSWKNDAALQDEISMLLKAGDARNEKEQGGGGRALFLSSVLARTATLDLTNFSALTSLRAYFLLTSKKFIAKTDLYQAEPFLFYPSII